MAFLAGVQQIGRRHARGRIAGAQDRVAAVAVGTGRAIGKAHDDDLAVIGLGVTLRRLRMASDAVLVDGDPRLLPLGRRPRHVFVRQLGDRRVAVDASDRRLAVHAVGKMVCRARTAGASGRRRAARRNPGMPWQPRQVALSRLAAPCALAACTQKRTIASANARSASLPACMAHLLCVRKTNARHFVPRALSFDPQAVARLRSIESEHAVEHDVARSLRRSLCVDVAEIAITACGRSL